MQGDSEEGKVELHGRKMSVLFYEVFKQYIEPSEECAKKELGERPTDPEAEKVWITRFNFLFATLFQRSIWRQEAIVGNCIHIPLKDGMVEISYLKRRDGKYDFVVWWGDTKDNRLFSEVVEHETMSVEGFEGIIDGFSHGMKNYRFELEQNKKEGQK